MGSPLYNYRWAFSWITKSALNAGNYNLEAFPTQSDQTNPAWLWTEPQRKGTNRPKLLRHVQNADLSQSGDGFWAFDWSIPFMTPLMFNYIMSNLWPTIGVESAEATVQTFDERINDYSAFQVFALMPLPGEHYTITDGYYTDVIYRFTNGTLIL